MKTLIALITLTATLAVAGNGIYGTWKLGTFNMGSMVVVATMTVTKDSKMTLTSTCTVEKVGTEVATVTVPVTITADTLTVLEEGAGSDTSKGFNCNANAVKGEVSYKVSADDNTLTMSTPQGSMDLPRQN